MKKLLIVFCLCLSFVAYSKSVISDSKSVIKKDSAILNSEKTVVNTDKTIIKENDTYKPFLKGNTIIEGGETFKKTAEKSSYRSEQIITVESSKSYTENALVGMYGKYLEIVAEENPQARDKFVQYLSDWQWTGQDKDFLTYSKNRAQQEEQLNHLYDEALKKFGAGSAIIATTWILSWVVPGGQVVSTALFVVAKTTTITALTGAASGGVISAGISFAQGKRGDELFHATINGVADGYFMGAVTGLVTGSFSAIKTFSHAVNVGNNIYTKGGNVLDKYGKTIGKTIRFEGVDKVDDIYYIGKNSTSVFDKNGKEVAKIFQNTKNGNYFLCNEKGRIVGYLKDGKLVSYNDPSSAALVKGQGRAKPSSKTIAQVKDLSKANGQYNPKTGNFIDAIDGSEILGTPEMGHVYGHEYTNELQRAFFNGDSAEVFKARMNDPSIYQLESVAGNRSHVREAVNLTVDSFKNVNKNVDVKELWKAVL